MIRPKTRRIVARERFTLPGGAPRERLTLECEHVVEKAVRKQRRAVVRVVCPACEGEA